MLWQNKVSFITKQKKEKTMKKLMITLLTVALCAGSLQAYEHEGNEHTMSKEITEQKNKKKRNKNKKQHREENVRALSKENNDDKRQYEDIAREKEEATVAY